VERDEAEGVVLVIEVYDIVQTSIVRAVVLGEGQLGRMGPAWKVRIIGGPDDGKESFILKDTPSLRLFAKCPQFVREHMQAGTE
jgi:hypothetical protein